MPDSIQQDGEVSEVWVHFFTVLSCLPVGTWRML